MLEARKLYVSGRSTVVSIPKALLRTLGANAGDMMLLSVERGCLTLRPLTEAGLAELADRRRKTTAAAVARIR